MTWKRFLHFLANHKHYVISFVIQIAIAGFLIHEWDGFVFITSASQFLQGVIPYEVAAQAPSYTSGLGIQMWYAYPPLPLLLFSSSYAPYFYLLGDNLILGRIFIKLTFILGNLLCAYLVYRLVAGVSSKEKAAKAEKIILYNPFLIFIAAAWGMFDIWMVNFLLLSLLSLRRDKFGMAGLYFGLSLLIKPIPIIFAPVLLAYVWNKRRNIAKPIIFASAAVAIFALVSLPFFLSCPQGFIDQVFGMHTGRPPFAWAPLWLLYMGGPSPISFPSLSSSAISAISTALLAVSILVVFLYYWLSKEREERGLLASLFLLMLTFTLFSKGVSPQHLVVPLVLAIALLYTYSDYIIVKVGDIKRYYKFLVLPYLGAALLTGHHYLTFIPPDVAMKLIGKSAYALDSQIAAGFPISPSFYYVITEVIMFVLIAPAIIVAAIIVFRSFKRIIPVISREASAYLLGMTLRIRRTMRREAMEKAVTILLVSLFLVAPPLAAVAAQGTGVEEGMPPPLHDRLVGGFYYFWDNSSYNPETPYDDWLEVDLTPEEGYYHSNISYIRDDIQQMKDAGIDFAILPFSDIGIYSIKRYSIFAQESEKEGFRFAPMIELKDNETTDEIIGLMEQALWFKDSPSLLTHDDKPVIFFKDVYHFDAESWDEVKEDIEERYGELYWIGSCAVYDLGSYLQIFDAVFVYSPATVWQADESPSENLEYWEGQASLLHEGSQKYDAPTIISTTPYFDNGEEEFTIPLQIEGEYSYDLFWEIALENEADVVLITAWNEYQTSSAIEPTVEFGDLFLEKTETWCTLFHAR